LVIGDAEPSHPGSSIGVIIAVVGVIVAVVAATVVAFVFIRCRRLR